MDLGPDIEELLARARADLRIGVPVVLAGEDGRGALVLATETLTPARLGALRALGAPLDIAVTARRAETLKARAYDGDLARIIIPEDAGLPWIRAVASPENDLA